MSPVTESHVPSPFDDRRRVWLTALVVSWGVQAIVTQSILLREAVVLMFGNEFAWGVVLFAWLFGVAVGAGMGGFAAERLRRPDVGLVVALTALSVIACVELWLFRGARGWLGVEPGELLPLPKTVVAAMVLVSPASVPVGMAFPLACCVLGRRSTAHTLQLGHVYTWESVGSLIGGAAFSFWAVEHLSAIQTILACGALVAAASAGFLRGANRRPYAAVWPAAAAVLMLLVCVVAGTELNRRLVEMRWRHVAPGYQLCAEVESKYQNLAIGRRADQFTLYSAGHVTADFPDPYTFVPLAHFWLCQHPAPRNVLVLGGGAEGLLTEILRHPVTHIDYVEPDPRQIELLRRYVSDADRRALDDPRVTVHHADARYFVKTQRDRFDLVIARLPEPMSALHARLYSKGFYRELRRAMTGRSVLCLTVTATPGRLSAASAQYLATIRATLRTSFPYVTIGWGNPAQVLAATTDGLVSTDPAELAKRYAQRGVKSNLFDPAWFEGATDWLDPAKIRMRAEQLDAVRPVQISTDLRPLVYLQRLALWEQMTGGRSGRVIEWLRSIGWSALIGALLAMTTLTFLVCRVRALPGTGADGQPENMCEKGDAPLSRDREGAVDAPPSRDHDGAVDAAGTGPLPHGRGSERSSHTRSHPRAMWAAHGALVCSVGSTGFVTMALTIIWLFAFQNLYGYVYQRIGWIVALFMAGLVLGCGAITWQLREVANTKTLVVRLWNGLVVVDTLLALLALLVPFVLPTLASLQGSAGTLRLVESCISLLVMITGLLGGAAFALAGGVRVAATGRPGSAAGGVVGADHVGACLGALFCGILLVPVFGTAATAFLLAGIKLSSVVLLLVGRRLSRAA